MSGEHSYKPVTQEIAVQLQSIVGGKNIIFNDVERMQNYSHDEVADPGYAHMPEVVVKPHSAQEISQILILANKYRIPVTPRGGGTGLSCGAVPILGGILLSLDRMNRILEIDKENMMVVVEPGVVTREINIAVQEHGLFYAGYPMSFESCFIGGNVAENAGGGRAIKYGIR
jgi:glycolate oxidase